MPFTEEHKVLIKHYTRKKKYGRKKLLKEFPEKNWSETGLRNILNKVGDTGDTKRKQGSGRPLKSRSNANIDTVENQNNPGIHLSLREIEMETGIPRASVHRCKIWPWFNSFPTNKCTMVN